MILDAYGRNTTKQTETQWDPKLMEALMVLDQLLNDNGLGLFCARCYRLGHDFIVQGNNDPASDTLRLTCQCAVRTFHKKNGAKRKGYEKVTDIMAVAR